MIAMKFKLGQNVFFDIGGKKYPCMVLDVDHAKTEYLVRVFNHGTNEAGETRDSNHWMKEEAISESSE